MQGNEIEISRLIENPDNPRYIDEGMFGKLVQSVLVFPRMLRLRPLVVDDKFMVLGGNMRLKALAYIAILSTDDIQRIIGRDERFTDAERQLLVDYWAEWQHNPVTPYEYADDLTEAQKQEFIFKDNASFGQWDAESMANKWSHLPLTDWGVPDWATNDTTKAPTEDAKDYSDEINNRSNIMEVECKDEYDMQHLYDELIERGYVCRILTL